MKITNIKMNVAGCNTRFDVDGHTFETTNYGDGLYYMGKEIIQPNFFSLNQETKSGRWKGIYREFNRNWDFIWHTVKEIEENG